MGATDQTILDTIHHAVDRAKANFRAMHVMIGYIAVIISLVGAIFLLAKDASNGGWVTAVYVVLVPLANTIAALTETHLLHFFSFYLGYAITSFEAAAYAGMFKKGGDVLLGIGFQLAVISTVLSFAAMPALWYNIGKVKDSIKSPFAMLAALSWVVTVVGLVTYQTVSFIYLSATVPGFFVITFFLASRLMPIQGLSAALGPAIAQQFVAFVSFAKANNNIVGSTTAMIGASAVATGLAIAIIVLVTVDYLRYHKPEDLLPELRAKIADIANAIPLLVAFICFVGAIACYFLGVVDNFPGFASWSYFVPVLVCMFNLGGALFHVNSFHYLAFGFLLSSFTLMCTAAKAGSAGSLNFWVPMTLATVSLLSMFCHNFVDTLKKAPEMVRRVTTIQAFFLVSAIFALIGALCFTFKNASSNLSGMMDDYYTLAFMVVLVFFETDNLPFMVMAFVSLLSYGFLGSAVTVKDGLLVTACVASYIAMIVAIIGFTLRPKATDEGDETSERSNLV